MDRDRIAAIAARAEQIKTNSAEFKWICRGIKPAPVPDQPVVTDPNPDPDQLQVQGRDQFLRPYKPGGSR